MKKFTFQIVPFLCLMCLVFSTSTVWADENKGFQLDLKNERPSMFPPRSLGEFSVSLDNRLVPQRTLADRVKPQRDLVDLPRGEIFPYLQDISSGNSPSQPLEEVVAEPETGESSDPSIRSALSSTFTFRPGYLQTHLPAGFSGKIGGGNRDRSGRLTLSGRHENDVVRLSQPTALTAASPRVFSNRIRPRGTTPAAAPGSLLSMPGDPLPSVAVLPVADNYFLEATYNFNPAVQGKVSYQRSQFDPTLKTEDLQVEGTVDTGRNTAIKAGFQNRTVPERPAGSAGDKKVFTEFILKF